MRSGRMKAMAKNRGENTFLQTEFDYFTGELKIIRHGHGGRGGVRYFVIYKRTAEG